MSPISTPTKRISKDEYYLGIALAVSKRSSCLKRHYGCIIVKNDEIIATGYNGSPRNETNCCDLGYCKRLNEPHNSGNYADCSAVHAEQNAMLAAPRRDMIGATLYLAGEELIDVKAMFDEYKYKTMEKCEPCPICRRMIVNAGIARIIGGLPRYVLNIEGLGYYKGPSTKYQGMFNTTSKELAKKYETIEEAEKIANIGRKDGYIITIEKI